MGGFIIDKLVVCYIKDLIEGISKIGEYEEDVIDLVIFVYFFSYIVFFLVDGLVCYFNFGICFYCCICVV